ncbi:UpxY family transcription antiterminator [uncultured Bacteroides sp.]|uniref:UpxY family transcription antiterminator n=1 Tax=uncultured Bacteroides sp. TaxID=162156 RepID=UPI0025D2CC2F|nr:UpxY family transcription antiterminator [uncultured Bacteroides sp.]
MGSTTEETGEETTVWYAMYAYKKELHVQKELKKENIESFIPMCYTIKEHHGRKERVLVPAISNLVFVRTTKSVLTEFKTRNPYLQYITQKTDSGRKIIIVPGCQMQDFIRVAQKYEEDLTYYKPEEICLEKGQKVRVHGGAFDGVEGVLLKVKGKRSKRIVIKIPGIVAIATAYIEPEFIEIIKPGRRL